MTKVDVVVVAGDVEHQVEGVLVGVLQSRQDHLVGGGLGELGAIQVDASFRWSGFCSRCWCC